MFKRMREGIDMGRATWDIGHGRIAQAEERLRRLGLSEDQIAKFVRDVG